MNNDPATKLICVHCGESNPRDRHLCWKCMEQLSAPSVRPVRDNRSPAVEPSSPHGLRRALPAPISPARRGPRNLWIFGALVWFGALIRLIWLYYLTDQFRHAWLFWGKIWSTSVFLVFFPVLVLAKAIFGLAKNKRQEPPPKIPPETAPAHVTPARLPAAAEPALSAGKTVLWALAGFGSIALIGLICVQLLSAYPTRSNAIVFAGTIAVLVVLGFLGRNKKIGRAFTHGSLLVLGLALLVVVFPILLILWFMFFGFR